MYRSKHEKKVINVLQEIYKKIYRLAAKKEGLPFSLILSIKYNYLWRIRDFYLPVYTMEGTEKTGGKRIRVLFCGDKPSMLYMSNLLFSEKPEFKFIGRWNIFRLDKVIFLFYNKTDLTIVKTDCVFSNFLNKKGFITIPAWVRMKKDVSVPFEEVVRGFKKSAKEDVRKVKQHGYSYEITKSDDKFNLFFYNIRQPYFRNRMGEQALPGSENYHELHNAFRYGKLFLVKDNEKYVAGFIVITKGKVARPHFMGIVEQPYFHQAAGSALFYLFMLWAKKQGFKVLDFGLTRAFLNNGAFRFKRKWRMHVGIGRGFHGVFGFKINNFKTKAVYDFFENNPFIYIDRGKLKGFVFVRNNVSSSEKQAIYKRYFTPGLECLYIINGEKKLKELLKKFKGWRDVESKRKKLNIILLNDKNRVEEDVEEYTLNREYQAVYKALVEDFPEYKKLIFRTLTVTLPQLKKKGFDVEKVDVGMLKNVFSVFKEKRFSKEGIPVLLNYILSHNIRDVEKAVQMCGLNHVSLEDAEKIIEQIVSDRKKFVRENGLESFKPLMGVVMKSLGGRVDGKVASEMLKSKIKEVMGR
ncbi:MAG TPA: GNAT family N-acetyltransferase [Thermoplasmatales archaeon]|nr:GNAT family N-acetyltransferase [Thermoplasmatales archaeon]